MSGKTLLLEDFTVLRKEESTTLVSEMSQFGKGYSPGSVITIKGRDREVEFVLTKAHRDTEGDLTFLEFKPTDPDLRCSVHLFND